MADRVGLRAVASDEGDEPPYLTCHERARQWLERAEDEMRGDPPRLGLVDVMAHLGHAYATLALTEPLALPDGPA